MIRWGVIGPGSIATGFAEAMQWAEGGTITAVASRSAERAEAFGDRFDIPKRYGDYDTLAADPDVDVVYVATPALAPRGGHHRPPPGRKARPVREAARAQRPPGGTDGGGGPEPWAFS